MLKNPIILDSYGQRALILPAVLIFASMLGPGSSAIATPALPAIASCFHAASREVQLAVPLNMLGIALSGLFYGPWSEAVGRRIPVLVGLLIFIISTLLASISPSIPWLLWSHLLQGIGAGVTSVLILTIVFDLFPGRRGVRMIAALGMTVPLAPALGPMLSGPITQFYGWRTSYLVLALLSIFCLVMTVLFLPETLSSPRRTPLKGLKIFKTYLSLLLNLPFIRICAIAWFGFAALWSYLTISPFVFIEILGLSPAQYGALSALSVIGIVLGSVLVRVLSKKLSLEKILLSGTVFCLVGTTGLLLSAALGLESPFFLALPMTVTALGCGIFFSTVPILSFEGMKHNKGYAAAIFRMGLLLAAAGGGALAALFYDKTFVPAGILMVVYAICSLILGLNFCHRKRTAA